MVDPEKNDEGAAEAPAVEAPVVAEVAPAVEEVEPALSEEEEKKISLRSAKAKLKAGAVVSSLTMKEQVALAGDVKPEASKKDGKR